MKINADFSEQAGDKPVANEGVQRSVVVRERVYAETTMLTSEGTWCSGITPAQHVGGPGFNPQCVHVF